MTTQSALASASDSNGVTKVHLTVFVHGLWGDPQHVSLLARSLAKAHSCVLSPALDASGSYPLDPSASSSTVEESMRKKASSKNEKTEAQQKAQREKEEAQVQKALDEVEDIDAPEPGWKLVLLNTVSNRWVNTYDGIDLCAERVIREIKAEIKRIEETGVDEDADNKSAAYQVRRLSIVGYSLGGLIIRYAIAVLWYQGYLTSSPIASKSQNHGRIESSSIYTFATPHIGVPPVNSPFGKLVHYVGGQILSRTGKQLYAIDEDWGTHGDSQALHDSEHAKCVEQRGLLEAMSEPGSVFMKALGSFKHVIVYANSLSDLTVPFRTGAIEFDDPFLLEGTTVNTSPSYPHLIESYNPQRAIPSDERSTLARLSAAVLPSSLPIFLRPSLYPFRPPWNYLSMLSLPFLLPALLCILAVRSRGQGKLSRKRIQEEEELWLKEQSLAAEQPNTNSRIQRMLIAAGNALQTVTEGVCAEEGEGDKHPVLKNIIQGNGAPKRDPSSSDRNCATSTSKPMSTRIEGPSLTLQRGRYAGSKLASLSEKQKLMVARLNALPNLRKHFTYFQDVTNSHGTIICRTTAIGMQVLGKDVVRHFAETFEL
ncbi:DUF676-domain-containing protein [Tilletiaria anomala UBC 951]|uniref:DUF676-domain-containing protein n=1 Tax=Tilletiaria anomala (strain ATCC 24038 / CBS 436.72 / UBC 951) TaxID=1037660 RepID=A0A066W297_TILAU|nr:DUF676-domain-containing protein [Tilletiaria anomala UBC 951]KDN44875.1 DUF676-domain-containing protein [Tilletiaria anomala UBC 951]